MELETALFMNVRFAFFGDLLYVSAHSSLDTVSWERNLLKLYYLSAVTNPIMIENFCDDRFRNIFTSYRAPHIKSSNAHTIRPLLIEIQIL